MNYSNSNNIELSFYFKPYIDNINLQLILKDTTTNNEHIISLNTNDFVLNEWNYINKIFIHELLSDISEKPYNNIQLTFSIQATNISNIDSSILVASIDDISMSGSLQKPMQYVSSRVF